MRDDQMRCLALQGQVPARLTAGPAGWGLNCHAHVVPILVAVRLLKPLGNPPPNCVNYFAARKVVELGQDRTWLAKATHPTRLTRLDEEKRHQSEPAGEGTAPARPQSADPRATGDAPAPAFTGEVRSAVSNRGTDPGGPVAGPRCPFLRSKY